MVKTEFDRYRRNFRNAGLSRYRHLASIAARRLTTTLAHVGIQATGWQITGLADKPVSHGLRLLFLRAQAVHR